MNEKTFKIDFTEMLKAQGMTSPQAKKAIKEHDKKVALNVKNGGTSYPSSLR
jgi:hypothetical protein